MSLWSSPADNNCQLTTEFAEECGRWLRSGHDVWMSRLRPLPPSLTTKPFSYADGIAAGLSARRIRAKDLAHPFRGVRTAQAPMDIRSLARSFSVRMSQHQYFSHVTAAELLGLRMPEGWRPEVLHVTSVFPVRAPRAHNIIGHQSGATATILVEGMRTAEPIATWIASATLLSIDDLIVMGDGLVRRKNPLATMGQLAETVSAHSGQRGYVKLSRALPQIRTRTDSARETLLRLIVVRAGFPEPEINPEIRNGFGAVIAHGDIVFREYRTIVEYDGGQHRTDERQFEIDIERLDQLMEEGWRVIRVGKSLMGRRATLFRKISIALEAGGWQPPR